MGFGVKGKIGDRVKKNPSYKGIISSWMKGMTFGKPNQCQTNPFQDPMFDDSMAGIS